jgi:DNA-binding transcriptional ArsR family regulator
MADARQFVILPFRALLNRNLTAGDRCVLEAVCAHTNAQGVCWPSIETIADLAGGITDRSVRRSLRTLEAEGLIKTEKVGSHNYYQVINDVPRDVALRAMMAEENRTPVSGVGSDKRHRTPVSGEGGGDPSVPSGQGGPVEGTRASGETGHPGPGERVQEQKTATTTSSAREADPMATRSGSDSDDDTGARLERMATDLAITANQALRDNPAMRVYAEIYPLRADLALTPLKDWLTAGIPFPLIQKTVAEVAARFTPARQGDRISRFTYFDRPIRDAHGKDEANTHADRAPAAPKKIRRLTA